jgi:hypothetical protein
MQLPCCDIIDSRVTVSLMPALMCCTAADGRPSWVSLHVNALRLLAATFMPSDVEANQAASPAQQRWSRPELLAMLLSRCQAEQVDVQDDEEPDPTCQPHALMTLQLLLQWGLPPHLLPPAGDRYELQLGVDCAY